MKTTLIEILWEKEKIHWKRIREMFNKFDGWIIKLTFGLMISIIIIISHYAFAIMHTMYEIFLWIFFRKVFKNNLQKLKLRI